MRYAIPLALGIAIGVVLTIAGLFAWFMYEVIDKIQ